MSKLMQHALDIVKKKEKKQLVRQDTRHTHKHTHKHVFIHTHNHKVLQVTREAYAAIPRVKITLQLQAQQ
jgi:hypothetical protein